MKIVQGITPLVVHRCIQTVGCILAYQAESRCDEAASGHMKEVLLIFCPTKETDEGFVEVSPRMKDLALMGFQPVALVRANPADLCEFSIYALPDLPGSIVYAISRESERLVLEAMSAVEIRAGD